MVRIRRMDLRPLPLRPGRRVIRRVVVDPVDTMATQGITTNSSTIHTRDQDNNSNSSRDRE